LVRIPQLEQEVSCPFARIIRTRPCDWIHLRDVREIFHTVGSPRVTVCARKLDTGRNRCRGGLIDDTCTYRQKVLHRTAHVDVGENVSACCSTSRSTWRRRGVLAELPATD